MMNFGVKVLIATLGLAIPFAPVQAKADRVPMNKVKFASKARCEDLKLNNIYINRGLNSQCAEEFLNEYLDNILGNFDINKNPSYDCGNNVDSDCGNNCGSICSDSTDCKDDCKDKNCNIEDGNNGSQNSENNNGEKEETGNDLENGGNQSNNSGQEKPDNNLENNGNQENNNQNNGNDSNVDVNNGENNSNGGSQENNGNIENGQVESSFSEFQNKVLELVNQERAKAGVKPLKGNLELSNVATIKSQDMIDKNYFDHNSPTYGSPFDMMRKFGIDFNMAGENIAYGQRTPEEVMKGWMNSPGHRKNILNPEFEQIGIGIAKNSNGVTYWTQMFIK